MKNSSSLRTLLFFFVLLLGAKNTRGAVLTVGSGTASSTVYPINSCWGYNYSQTIYYASDLIAAGATAGSPLTIANLQYNITTFVASAKWKDWIIYMANTSATNFSTTTSWLPVAGMTKVYDGTVNPVSTGWYNITLATPFIWDGVSNVVIAIDENTPDFTCTAGWQNTTTTPSTTFRSIMYRSDGTNPDPASPPTASARGASIPNFRIFTPCVGAPTGGTAISSAGSLICGGTSTTLTVTGSTGGSGIAYQWEASTSATGPWTAVAGATTDNLTIVPPSCNTQYYRLKVTCIASASSDISSVVKVETSCALTPPYFETFESITTANTLPSCMSSTSLGSLVTTYLAASTYNRSNHTPGGNKYAAFRYSSNDWIYTPPIMLTAGKTYEFSFWYIADGYTGWDTLKAAYGSLPVEGAMTSALGTPITAVSNTVYTKYKSSFVAGASGVQYFGIKVKANGVPWYLSVDDLSLQEVPDCAGMPSPGLPSASPNRLCGSGVVDLDLPGLPLAVGYTYKWQDSTVGGTWRSDPGRPSFDGNKIPFKTGTIDKNTYFRCIVTCTFTGETAVSSPVLVLAGPYDPPYFETFESITANNQLPTCMSSTGTLVQTYTAPSTYFRTNHTPGGSKFASFRWGCDDYLFSPPMNLKAGYQYIISFWYITDGYSGWNTLGVKMGTDATAAGMTTSLKMLTTPINTTYQQYADTIIAPTTGTFYFGIYCDATSAPWYLSVDDIGVQFRPCNGKPDAGTITSTIPSGAGTCPKSLVTLTAGGATPTFVQGIQYQWQRRDLSSPLSWNNVSGANTETLSADTLGGYEYRFAVVCTNTGDSSFSPVFVLPQLNAHPPVSISPSSTPATFCLGDTVKFNATNFSGTTYDWMKDSVVIPGWKFSDIGVTEAGTYMVKASSSVAPCPAYSNEVVLNVNDPGYAVSISTPADSIICEGKSITLFGTASKPGVTYQWSKNNSPIAGATGNSILINTTGYYQIRAFDGSSFCPALSRTVFIKVNPVPAAVINVPGGTTTACENDGVFLKATSGLFAYEWSRNGMTVVGMNDSNQLVKAPGKYQVKVRSAEGCVSISSTVDVTILPAPTPTISKSGLVLSTSSPYFSYVWVRNGKDTVSRTSTLNLTKKGFYKVYVEDANGCKGMSNPIEILDESLSLEDISATDNQIRLYPNPTNSMVTVESPIAINIEVKDMTGKTILVQKNSKMIDLSNYPDGIYLFIISDNDKLINQQRVTKISGR